MIAAPPSGIGYLGIFPNEIGHKSYPQLALSLGRIPRPIESYVHLAAAFPTAAAQAVIDNGAIPLITLQPLPPNGPGNLDTILSGQLDVQMAVWAAAAVRFGQPFFLRFAHEMNGSWYSWGTSAKNPFSNTPAKYVTAWKRARMLMPIANATWLWCAASSGAATFASCYPGDAWVDWIGFDAYESGQSSMVQLFGNGYAQCQALNPYLPIAVCETSVLTGKGPWITQGLLTDIPTQMPAIKSVTWFDAVTAEGLDWALGSDPAAVTAFSAALASPLWSA